MSAEAAYVCDANVIVSALLFEESAPGRAFGAALDQGGILLSADVFAEITEVLRRPKFDRYLTREERDAFLKELLRQATLVEVSESITDCRDPKDNKYLELAVAGKARCLVSGDRDLLDLHPFRGIPIRTPQEFLADLAGRQA
jgi:uncharacterized protein